MYIASLRVRAKDGRVGTNAFLHLHRDQRIPTCRKGELDLDAIASLQGGYLVAQSTELEPGGNDVLAHLDLAASDDVTEASLSDIVQDLRRRIGSVHPPVLAVRVGLAARFGANIGFDPRPDELRQLLDTLWSAARALLDHRQALPPPVNGPYVAWVEPAADGVRLWLPPATLDRLPRSVRRGHRVLVTAATMAAGEPAELLREAATMLLDLSESQLAQQGGIELIEPRSGTVVAAFPATAST